MQDPGVGQEDNTFVPQNIHAARGRTTVRLYDGAVFHYVLSAHPPLNFCFPCQVCHSSKSIWLAISCCTKVCLHPVANQLKLLH